MNDSKRTLNLKRFETVYCPDNIKKFSHFLNETVDERWLQSGQALTLFITKDLHESRFLFTFANTNRQINRNLGASREQSQDCLNYAEAKPWMPLNRNLRYKLWNTGYLLYNFCCLLLQGWHQHNSLIRFWVTIHGPTLRSGFQTLLPWPAVISQMISIITNGVRHSERVNRGREHFRMKVPHFTKCFLKLWV